MDYRQLATGQRSEVWTAPAEGGPATLLFTTDTILIEAPNWSADGESLYVNGAGKLWRLDVASPTALHEVEFVGLPPINNDHVLTRDGQWVFLSAMDGHIYKGALTGGPVTRVSPDDGTWHFLHGVTSDASRLAYVELGDIGDAGRLMVSPGDGLPGVLVDTGPKHIDGPEWSADDAWIYFNTEGFTSAPGHAQLARIADPGSSGDDEDEDGDGGGGVVERLVASDTVDWFPHPSPDGSLATYLAFPAGTLGHPADLAVEVRLVRTADWSTPIATYPLFGGQGTLNVNSWSPDSRRFAFVAYPVAD
ncbi:TolB family protein [Frondihabitans cladoniiphilus]|uniref:WD40 repeat protein n=1 Tax=Frondihabitans cladoniiphilus TaxID=715785 RepID=A0ABP8WEM7_9MICO